MLSSTLPFHIFTTNNCSYLTESSSPTLLCFENVFSGLYLFSDHGEDTDQHGRNDSAPNPHLVSRGDVILHFRQGYMKRMGLDTDMDLKYHTCDYSQHRPGSIVVLVRGAGSREYWWDVQKLMNENEKDWDVTLVGLNNTYGSMQDQVKMIARAKVLVTMVGGSSCISWFLPPGSTLILLQRHQRNGSSNHFLDSNIYSNWPHIHTRFINYKETSDEGENIFDWQTIWLEILDGLSRYDDVNKNC
jgi:hypothetical protein